MLATADIVFLVDESGSEQVTHEWLKALVTGDTDNDGTQDIESLAERLADEGITDLRYGLVGFGEQNRFAHSHVVGDGVGSVFERLWSDGPTLADHTADLKAAIAQLAVAGDSEDGWDAIDHAIAEYDFRPGAVPMFVLIQGEDVRVANQSNSNRSLTHEGVLAALKGKNVILNTLTVGHHDGSMLHSPFDLQAYGLNSDVRVLGVDADVADGVQDGVHNYHWTDTNTSNGIQAPTETTAESLQISYNGSNTGATGMVESGKSILISRGIENGIGPSSAGYRAKSIPYAFESMTGGDVPQNGPNGSINFSFPFFDTVFPRLWVNQDGTVTFADPAAPTGTTNIDPGPNNVDLSRGVGFERSRAADDCRFMGRPSRGRWLAFSTAPEFGRRKHSE